MSAHPHNASNPLLEDLDSLLFSICESERRSSASTLCADSSSGHSDETYRLYKEMLLQNGRQWPLDCDSLERTIPDALNGRSPQEIQDSVVPLINIVEDLSGKDKEDGNTMLRERRSELCAASLMSVPRSPVCETRELKYDVDVQGRKVINRYIIVSELGHGTNGSVFFAKDSDTNTNVAIKSISKKYLRIPIASNNNALCREIAVMKKLRHRNCVSLLEVIDAPKSNNLYLVMEYMPYGPVVRVEYHKEGVLSDVFKNTYLLNRVSRAGGFVGCEPLPEDLCARYLRQLVSGLRYLHERGVIHHDIKPDNILLGEDGRVCFSDFGVSEIAKPVIQSSRKALMTARNGAATPLFSAPEEFEVNRKGNCDAFMTDVWALGVTLYLMLVGVAPFNGSTYFAVAKDIREASFPWNGYNVSEKKLDNHWKTILDGMLAKNPQERWTLRRLKTFLDQESTLLQNATPISPVKKTQDITIPITEDDICRATTSQSLVECDAFGVSLTLSRLESCYGMDTKGQKATSLEKINVPASPKQPHVEQVDPPVERNVSQKAVEDDNFKCSHAFAWVFRRIFLRRKKKASK